MSRLISKHEEFATPNSMKEVTTHTESLPKEFHPVGYLISATTWNYLAEEVNQQSTNTIKEAEIK